MKILKKIRMLFCFHQYLSCGASEGKYGTFEHYRCGKCGKCIQLQIGGVYKTNR